MAKILKLDDKLSSDNAAENLTPQEISDDDDEEYERYIPVEQSIIGSLLDIREMRAGRMPEQTWDEFAAELRAVVAEVEAEERAKANVVKNNRINRAFQG